MNNRFCVKVQCLHQMSGSFFLFTACFPNGKIEKFAFECGRFNDAEKEKNEFFPLNPKDCKFLVITHAHDDHLSRVPLFVKHGFNGNIYTTATTCKFANFILYNNSYIYEREQNDYYVEPLYNDVDVEKSMKHFIACPYRKVIKPTKNISFILYENGHIPGACLIYLVVSYPGEKDIVILFTGDYHYKSPLFAVPSLPESVTKNDISLLITESTYGTTNSYDISQSAKLIKELSLFLSEGKTVIIPAFALARSSTCVYLIGKAQKAGILPSVPIWLDSYSAKAFHKMFVYDNIGLSINTRELIPSTFKPISSPSIRNQVLQDRNPKIVISSAGFGDKGSVTCHIKSGIVRDDVVIFYCSGYLAPNSIGIKLQNAKKGEKIVFQGKELEVKCDFAITSELSAHAKKDELFDHIYSPCSYTHSYLTTHGEFEVCEALASSISNTFAKPASVIHPNVCYTIDSSGIIQSDNISIY